MEHHAGAVSNRNAVCAIRVRSRLAGTGRVVVVRHNEHRRNGLAAFGIVHLASKTRRGRIRSHETRREGQNDSTDTKSPSLHVPPRPKLAPTLRPAAAAVKVGTWSYYWMSPRIRDFRSGHQCPSD